MQKKELFTPEGYISLRWIREEFLELKNTKGEIIFKDEKDLDNILTQFWFKDREKAFIALEHVFPIFKKYLENTPPSKTNRPSFYNYTFKKIDKKTELTNFSIKCEQFCKNEFTEAELTDLIKDTELTTNWLTDNHIIKKYTDEKGDFYSTSHHTITEYLTAESIINSGNIDSFKEWSTLTTPTKIPQTYFNQSWYGVAQFLLESDLFDQTLDFFLLIGEGNNEVVDQNFSENISRINFPDPHDPRKDQLFSLIYNVNKNSNRWISPWAQEGIANLYTDNQLKILESDLLNKPVELTDIVRTCNAISILGELIKKKVITDKKELDKLKGQFITYTKQPITTGVLQRESLSALSSFGDISIISETASYFKNLNNNTKEKLVAEAFLRFCYTTDPNNHQSIDVALDSIWNNHTKVYAWQGLKLITFSKSLLYFLEQISNKQEYLNGIIDGENIFLDTKYESSNPLFDNLSKLSKTNPSEFLKLTKRITHQASELENFYPDFNRSKFIDFIINASLEIDSNLSDYLLKDLPSNWSNRQYTSFIALLSHSVNQNNYVDIYQTIKDRAGDHIGAFIRNIKDKAQREVLSGLKWDKQAPREPEFPITSNTHLEEFHKKLYPDQNNHEVYMTDLFEYYLQSKNQIGELSEEDRRHLWDLAFTKGLNIIDPATFRLKIHYGSGGKSFSWSSHAAFYGDMVRVVKDLEPNFDFTKYRSNLIQFIPFTYSEDLTTISEIIGTSTDTELVLLNKIYLNKKSDRRYLNPESYIRFVKDLHERWSGISTPKKVLESFLNDPKIDDWVQISAIEALEKFTSKTDKVTKKKLEEIGEGTGAKSTAAISTLISVYNDKKAIKRRFEQIKNQAVPKKARATGTVYSLDSEESEYSRNLLPKVLIDSKDPKLAKLFFDLLKGSLSYDGKSEYEGYVRYINRIVEMYLTNVASPKNYKLIEQLEKTVGKSSLYWNYQLPLLKVSYLAKQIKKIPGYLEENENTKFQQIPPDLIVEDTYPEIYKLAWLKIYSKKETFNVEDDFKLQCEFKIVPAGGSLYHSLRNIPHEIIHNKQIWLYDFDSAYGNYVDHLKNAAKWQEKESDDKTGKLLTSHTNPGLSVLMLPVPDFRSNYASTDKAQNSRFEIELYFEDETLSSMIETTDRGKTPKRIEKEHFPFSNKGALKLDNDCKTIIRTKMNYRSRKDFKHFKILFSRIYQIFDIPEPKSYM